MDDRDEDARKRRDLADRLELQRITPIRSWPHRYPLPPRPAAKAQAKAKRARKRKG